MVKFGACHLGIYLCCCDVRVTKNLAHALYWQTLYGFPMVVAICFRLTSNGAAQLRDDTFKRLYGAKEKTAIVLQLYGGTNAFS